MFHLSWGQHHLLPGRLMCCNELPVACHWSPPSSANQRPQLSSSDQSEASRVMTSRLPIITHIRRDSLLLIKGISCRPPLLFATARYIKMQPLNVNRLYLSQIFFCQCQQWIWIQISKDLVENCFPRSEFSTYFENSGDGEETQQKKCQHKIPQIWNF